MVGAVGIEPTSEPWGLQNVPTSIPRGQTNPRPELPFSTVPDSHSRKENSPPALLCRTLRPARKDVARSTERSKPFSNPQPNPQNAMSCTTYEVFGSPRGLVSGILNYCRTKVRFGVVEAINGNIKTLLRRGRGYKNLAYLLLKAQRMAVTKTEFIVVRKAA